MEKEKKDMQYTFPITLRRVRVTFVALDKAINIKYSECVSVFFT